ncbi:probable protein S-acyltransferase 16 [Hibiscus syriacus]|uniref:probable protein S-acyltransferase 16 n=1 Tax=Hibiscus syriacus TaxID=106335 RepID=UPI001922AA30|nr:probable protein S-acyltransferase 16 [Hibiscus syriacus]
MNRGFIFWVPVTVVVSSIVFVYFSTLFVFIERWFGLLTSPGIMNVVSFTSFTVMRALNYIFAITMDPGRVPSTFLPFCFPTLPDFEDSSFVVHEIQRKGGDLTYCPKCSHFKPPRAHHCFVCKICLLRMTCDRHFIWINNCVGHANYKVFFIFLVYAEIACIYSLVLLVGSLTNDSQSDERQSTVSFGIIYVVFGLLLLPLSLALSVLLGWHTYLILQNKTTIEAMRILFAEFMLIFNLIPT